MTKGNNMRCAHWFDNVSKAQTYFRRVMRTASFCADLHTTDYYDKTPLNGCIVRVYYKG